MTPDLKATRWPELNERYRAEGWGKVAEAALNTYPENVEAQARQVARYAHAEIERLRATVEPLKAALAEATAAYSKDGVGLPDVAAVFSYAYADAMLAERVKESFRISAQVRNAALEEAAQKADQKLSDKGYYGLAKSVRDAIRALKEQEPQE